MRETGLPPEAQHEIEKRGYGLEIVGIEPGDKSNIPKEIAARFDWPAELNGKGFYDRPADSYTVRYPKGDVFLSFITTIHELGHPRQHDENAELQHGGEQTHENLVAEEVDAWKRGWDRFVQANPVALTKLKTKFESYKNDGKLEEFDSFESLYEWVKELALKTVELQKVLFEPVEDGVNKMEKLATEMEKAGIGQLFEKFAKVRVGEQVDSQEMEKAINNVIKKVVELPSDREKF